MQNDQGFKVNIMKQRKRINKIMQLRLLLCLLITLVITGFCLNGCSANGTGRHLPQGQTESGWEGQAAQEAVQGYSSQEKQNPAAAQPDDRQLSSREITEFGVYTSKDQVALYLHQYGRLPENFITKNEALKLGWDSKAGNLWEVAPGKSIGGSHFGNYEGQLPEKQGRRYFECDIDYQGGRRNAKRIIYSDDGLIFYTEDHYSTFEQLY